MKDYVDRITISLPSNLLEGMDQLVKDRGFDSRSQAFTEMLSRELERHKGEQPNSYMTGTIVLVYDHTRIDLKHKMADIQSQYISEVISSLHVLLEDGHTMEVVLVQGLSTTLKKIANEMTTCKGVRSGKMMLHSTLMPPIQHP